MNQILGCVADPGRHDLQEQGEPCMAQREGDPSEQSAVG